MKILFNIHSLQIGGAETVVANYLLALKKMGYDVVLVLDERKESFLQDKVDREGIRTLYLRSQNSDSFWGKVRRFLAARVVNYQKRWARILELEKPDIVHLHSNSWMIPFPMERTIFTFHSAVERNLSILGNAHKERLMVFADGGVSFFCLNDQAQADVQRIFCTKNIVRIPNGVDLEGIRSRIYDRTDFLRQLQIPEDAFVLGHVGRIHPVKNHAKVLEIFAEVIKRRTDARLILVGTGEVDYVASIKRQVCERGLEKRVIFLGLRSDSTEIMSTFDALVLPSLSEAFPLTLVEAQALGVRCVASDVVPMDEVCNDNCFTLGLAEPADKWAEYILGNFTQKKSSDLAQFDMSCVVETLSVQYEKLLHKD